MKSQDSFTGKLLHYDSGIVRKFLLVIDNVLGTYDKCELQVKFIRMMRFVLFVLCVGAMRESYKYESIIR